MLITIAEPDLQVLAKQVSAVMNGTVLVYAVGIGVGAFLMVAILRIVFRRQLANILMLFYMLMFALALMLVWNNLNDHLKTAYGGKVYKLALSSGCTCPNRDGTLDSRGCIFCDGAGAFAAAGEIGHQLEAAKSRVAAKVKGDAKYIAYFQSFTNTYAPVKKLRALYTAAIAPEDIVGLAIGTRPI